MNGVAELIAPESNVETLSVAAAAVQSDELKLLKEDLG